MKFSAIVAATASSVSAIKSQAGASWKTQTGVSTSSLKEAATGLGLYVGSALNAKYDGDATYVTEQNL
jgi:hypothetical protein